MIEIIKGYSELNNKHTAAEFSQRCWTNMQKIGDGKEVIKEVTPIAGPAAIPVFWVFFMA